MLKKYQEFFKVNNLKLFLKYDGVRDKKVYTVRVFKKHSNGEYLGYGGDTNEPIILLSTILDEQGLKDSIILKEDIYCNFRKIEHFFIQKLGVGIIISMTFEYKNDKFEYTIIGKKIESGKEEDFVRLIGSNIYGLLLKMKELNI